MVTSFLNGKVKNFSIQNRDNNDSTNDDYTVPQTIATEVKQTINKFIIGKSQGIDLINSKIIKRLPSKAIRMLMILFNAVLRLKYFPSIWKYTEIMFHKLGKELHQSASYRSISLLPAFAKIWKK